MIKRRLERSGGLGHTFEIDIRLVAQAAQHVQQVLGCEIARCTGRVWAAAEATRRAVKRRESKVEGGQDVGQSGASRVVKVHGKF